MLTPDAAWQHIVKRSSALEAVSMAMADALGSVLAESILSCRDLPPCDRSSVDGYAVRSRDLENPPATLRVLGEIPAGSPATPAVEPGSCVRIFTGACLPPGADAVEMIEYTQMGNEPVEETSFQRAIPAGSNVLRKGEDRKEGEVLLAPGERLTPVQIGILAANGNETVRVHRHPRVTILVTGEELVEGPTPLPPHQIYDSNGPMVAALLKAHGFEVVRKARTPDDLDIITREIERSIAESDVVILTGGASVGKFDFVSAAIGQAGGEIVFHGIAMKPGKPQLFATWGTRAFAFGLPGNPLSALTGMTEFVLPALHRLAGLLPSQCRVAWRLPLTSPVRVGGPRRRLLPGRVVLGEDGATVESIQSKSSGDLASAGPASGSILAPEGVATLEKGTIVSFRPWWGVP